MLHYLDIFLKNYQQYFNELHLKCGNNFFEAVRRLKLHIEKSCLNDVLLGNQLAFTCSKSTTETLETDVKNVQS